MQGVGMSEFSPFPPGEGPTCPKCDADLVNGTCVSMRTQMAGPTPGYDENGVYHSHDPNWSTSTYECENGHTVKRKTRKSCPGEGCDFGGEEKLIVVE